MTEEIDIRSITVLPSRRRDVDPSAVEALIASIRQVGLLQPIVIDEGRLLIAGLHRLRACEALGWRTVPCVIRPHKAEEWEPFADELDAAARLLPEEADAKLAEIDENLIRSGLTALEKAEYIALRKKIYEIRFPETKHGKKSGTGPRGKKTGTPLSGERREELSGHDGHSLLASSSPPPALLSPSPSLESGNGQKGNGPDERGTVEPGEESSGHDGLSLLASSVPLPPAPLTESETSQTGNRFEQWATDKRQEESDGHDGHLVTSKSKPFYAATAAATGMSERTVRRLARIGEMPEEIREEIRGTPEENSVTALEAIAKRPHISHNSGEMEWYTPPHIIEAARAAMGGICVDPATSAVAQRFVEADNFYTAEDDGLKQPWWGNVWLNPPYARGVIDQFIAQLIENWSHEDFAQACVLVNNATETAWFQNLAEVSSAICFIRGRVKFLDETGSPARSPLQGQVVFYVGHSPDRFVGAFDELGLVVRL